MKTKKYFLRQFIAIAILACLASCSGCEEDSEEETTAEPESAGMSEQAVDDGNDEETTETQIVLLADAISDLQAQVTELQAEVEQLNSTSSTTSTVSTTSTSGTSGCGQIQADGTIIQCTTDESTQTASVKNGTVSVVSPVSSNEYTSVLQTNPVPSESPSDASTTSKEISTQKSVVGSQNAVVAIDAPSRVKSGAVADSIIGSGSGVSSVFQSAN